jgi:deoxyribodipyrimidine photo-lyase
MQTVQLVWFKRDLRVADHQALAQAAKLGTVLPLYVFEPDLWRQPEMDPTHFQFVCQSLQELGRGLNELGLQLHSFTGDVIEVLRGLQSQVAIASVHSHEETGGKWTYDRDLRVKAWLQASGIPWFEYPQNGVVRGLRNRDRWAATWKERMSQLY